ncbi:MAG: hypothetical protein ACKN9W_19035 [Methylococcus sp.]
MNPHCWLGIASHDAMCCRPPRVAVALLAGLGLMASAGGHGSEPPEPAGSTVTLDGVACRYPTEAMRLAEPGPVAWVVSFTCENQTSRALPSFESPRLSLVDAAGRESPADSAAPGSDRPGSAALPPGGRFAGAAVFRPSPDAPPGPWRLQVRTPGRSILLAINLPPAHP